MTPAYVINLDRCAENWELMKTTWADNFALERVSAVDGRAYGYSGRVACRMSHLFCMKRLSLRPEPYQIILEDDVYPTAAFSELWPAIRAFLDSGREDWDMIVLDPIVQYEKPTLTQFTPELLTITASRASGGIIYRTKFLKENIDRIAKKQGAFDMMLLQDPTYRKLTPRKLIMRQRAGKPSETSGTQNTDYYDTFYDNTEAYLAART